MKRREILKKFVGTALMYPTLSTFSFGEEAKRLSMGGNPSGSLFYAQAQAIAALITKYSNYKVDVFPQSTTVYLPMMQAGDIDFGLATPVEGRYAYLAEGPYEKANGGKGYDIRTIMLGSPIRLSLVVRGSSNIYDLPSLRGKKVVAEYGGFFGSTVTAKTALANGGLTVNDIRLVKVSSYPEGVQAVMEGRADAAVASLGSGIIQQLEAQNGARILPIDNSKEAMERAKQEGPVFFSSLVKGGDAVGVKDDTNVLSYAEVLYARDVMENEAVRSILDTLWDNYRELGAVHRSLDTWTPDRFASEEMVVPYHPAAIEFYKSKSVWSDVLDQRQLEITKKT